MTITPAEPGSPDEASRGVVEVEGQRPREQDDGYGCPAVALDLRRARADDDRIRQRTQHPEHSSVRLARDATGDTVGIGDGTVDRRDHVGAQPGSAGGDGVLLTDVDHSVAVGSERGVESTHVSRPARGRAG